MAASDGDKTPDGDEVSDGEVVSDAPGTRGGAQIQMPLPTGNGPLTAGTTGLDWAGAAWAGPVGVELWGATGTIPGRLCRGWGTALVGAFAAAGAKDPDVEPLGADGAAVVGGGAAVVGGEGDGAGGDVVVVDLGGAWLVGGVIDVGGVEGGGGDDGQVFPSVTVTSFSVRFTLDAQVHKLHASLPCPAMVAPFPFTVMRLVATGRPLPLAAVPSVDTT
ncbi:MAG TPA: hypothetical protein VF005_05480 [Acidimicrobiales bacterium]